MIERSVIEHVQREVDLNEWSDYDVDIDDDDDDDDDDADDDDDDDDDDDGGDDGRLKKLCSPAPGETDCKS